MALLRAIEQRVTVVALEEWAAIPLEHRANLSSAEALTGVFGHALAVSLACIGRHDTTDYRWHEAGWSLFTRDALRMVRKNAHDERESLDAMPADNLPFYGGLEPCSHIRPGPQ